MPGQAVSREIVSYSDTDIGIGKKQLSRDTAHIDCPSVVAKVWRKKQ